MLSRNIFWKGSRKSRGSADTEEQHGTVMGQDGIYGLCDKVIKKEDLEEQGARSAGISS
jgi:hypothetical protein